MKIRPIIFLLAIGVIGLSSYLLVPYEFTVNFDSKTLPGDVIETIRIWNRSMDSSRIIAVDSFTRVNQTLVINTSEYDFNWKFTVVDDSTTKVSIKVSEPAKHIRNKFLVPFTKSKIETDVEAVARQFYDVLKEHLNITKVTIVGDAIIDSSFCVCRTMEAQQIDKANGMMADYPLLTSFISQYKLKPSGLPLIRFNKWSHSANKIAFDFCFPIEQQDTLPIVNGLVYKKFKSEKAIHAIYNGNYITSDRAWYELLRYAESKGIDVKNTPVERFHNNPNLGLNELQWRADIYLPLIDK